MSTIFFNTLRKTFPDDIDDVFIDNFIDKSTAIELKKNEILVRNQTIENGVFYIVKGSFMKNVFSSDNEEKTVMFHTNSFFNFMVCSDSYISGDPTDYTIIANEDSLVLKIKQVSFHEFLDENQAFFRYYAYYHETSFAYFEATRDKYLSLTSEEYLKWLYKNYPFLFKIFPSKNIASFMGITPVWFSNLKRRLFS